MISKTVILSLLSVTFVSFGQILFKYSGNLLYRNDNQLHLIGVIVLSFFVSGLGSLTWIYLLRTVELNKVYPVLALSFIVVPILSVYYFEESLTKNYMLGIILICAGITLTLKN